MRLFNLILVTAACILCVCTGSLTHADELTPAVAPPSAPAQPPCPSGRYAQCLGDRYSHLKPDDPLAIRLKTWADEMPQKGATFSQRLTLARAELVNQRTALVSPPNADPAFATQTSVIQQGLQEAIREIDTIVTSGGDPPKSFASYRALNGDYWKLAPGASEPHGVPYKYLQDAGCVRPPPSDSCATVYTNAQQLADELFVIDEVISFLQATERDQLLDDAKTREDHWHAYLYDTQFQFWWELALNYAIEKRCPVFLRWDCTPPKTDRHDNELGFREPPQNKLIFLHPDIAVEYLHREPAGQRFKPVIAFQWLGYQHWDWKGEGVTHLMGIAVVSTVADTSVSQRVGTGIMLQWKRFSLAVTGRPKEVGVAINLNVVDWIGSVNPSWESKLKAPLTQ